MRAKRRASSAVPRQESLAHVPSALQCTIDSRVFMPGCEFCADTWQDGYVFVSISPAAAASIILVPATSEKPRREHES